MMLLVLTHSLFLETTIYYPRHCARITIKDKEWHNVYWKQDYAYARH